MSRTGLSGLLFGATILAAATSLPEFRPARRIARLGLDSLVVLPLYAAGVAGLFAIAA